MHLALDSVINSQIALFFALHRTIASANEKGTLQQNK